jgi:hypothetical protein
VVDAELARVLARAVCTGALLLLSTTHLARAQTCLDAATSVEIADGWEDAYDFDVAGHAVDAQDVRWIGIPDHAVEQRGASPGCFVGGYVEGPYDEESVYECEPIHCPGGVCPTPCLAYHTSAGLDVETSAPTTLEDVRVSDYGDGIERAEDALREPLVVKRAYLHDLHDDAIENDWGASITVLDSLLERVHTAFASRPRSSAPPFDASDRVFEVRDSLVLLHAFPNTREMDPGHGKIWKWPKDGMGPAFVVTGNTFVVTDYGGGLLLPLADQVLECAGNTLLWAASPATLDDWLGDVEIDSDGLAPAGRLAALSHCFTLVVRSDTETQADFLAAHFDPLVAAWKQSHPAALPPAPQAACNDGLDNDGDAHVDALDPGCAASDDVSELGLVQCDDGLDNDDNGLVDMEDPDCVTPRDQRERRTTGPRHCGLGFELVALLPCLGGLARRRRRQKA